MNGAIAMTPRAATSSPSPTMPLVSSIALDRQSVQFDCGTDCNFSATCDWELQLVFRILHPL